MKLMWKNLSLNWMRCGLLLKAETMKYGFGFRIMLVKFYAVGDRSVDTFKKLWDGISNKIKRKAVF